MARVGLHSRKKKDGEIRFLRMIHQSAYPEQGGKPCTFFLKGIHTIRLDEIPAAGNTRKTRIGVRATRLSLGDESSSTPKLSNGLSAA